MRNISLTGVPGAGKSTIAKILSELEHMQIVSSGDIFRQYAKEQNLSVFQLNKKINEEIEKTGVSSTDSYLDNRMMEYENKRDYIIDSRIGYYTVPSSFKVFLYCEPKAAAKRIFNAKRDTENYNSIEECMDFMYTRMQLEQKRFKTLYGTDPYNLANYDLVIDTTGYEPNDIATYIMSEYLLMRKDEKIVLLNVDNLYPTQVITDFYQPVIDDYISILNEKHNRLTCSCYIYANRFFILDGHHRVVATRRTGTWYIQANIKASRHFPLLRKSYYDFEALLGDGVLYNEYPDEMENEPNILTYDKLMVEVLSAAYKANIS